MAEAAKSARRLSLPRPGVLQRRAAGWGGGRGVCGALAPGSGALRRRGGRPAALWRGGSLTPSRALSCGCSEAASRTRCPPARQLLPVKHMRRPMRARLSPGAAPFRGLCCYCHCHCHCHCRRRCRAGRPVGGLGHQGQGSRALGRCPPRPTPYVTLWPPGRAPSPGAGAASATWPLASQADVFALRCIEGAPPPHAHCGLRTVLPVNVLSACLAGVSLAAGGGFGALGLPLVCR